MSFPKYYATYCVMDGDAGANPFWHASLVLSQQDIANGPIIVKDAVGFYSQPSTSTNPFIRGLKYLLGFNIDLQDGHGVLVQEKMRDIDSNGLHGITFETTEEKFNQLQALYAKRIADEKAAIAELNSELGENANGHTRYVEEMKRARVQDKPSRLYPFHVSMRGLFDTSASHACKNYALNLLLEVDIIDIAMRDKITGGPTKHAFPRYSNLPLPSMRLVSTGDPIKHVSRHTARAYYNREWGKNNLFWATQPFLPLADTSPTALVMLQKQYRSIKSVLDRTRHVELMLRQRINQLTPPTTKDAHHLRLEEQLKRVQNLYEKFSVYSDNIPKRLNLKLAHAETVLNVATMSLTPERVNYSFLFRVYESIAIRHAIIGLLVVALAAAVLSSPAGAIVGTAAALYAAYQCNNFFNQEKQFSKMRADYLAFQPKEAAAGDSEEGELTPSLGLVGTI